MEQVIAAQTETTEQTPVISVIVPVYNAEKYLRACLKSIREQTFTQWEAILVDDGSTDGSGAICDEAEKNDPRFRVIHKENGGVSTARNTGIEAARGEFLIFADADDICRKTYFEKMLDAMRTYEPDLVIGGFDRFRDGFEKEHLITRYSITLMKNIKQFLHLYTEPRTNMFGISVWAKLYRREMIERNHIRFDPEISYEEDGIFIADCVPYIKTVAVVGESLYRYRQMDESLSKGYRKDTFRFLVNGLRRRRALLKTYDMEWYLFKLDQIFMIVVKAACMKIEQSDISRKEKRADYRELIGYEESQDACKEARHSKTRLTRWIAKAVCSRSVNRLDLVMRLWHTADSAVHLLNRMRGKLGKLLHRGKRPNDTEEPRNN